MTKRSASEEAEVKSDGRSASKWLQAGSTENLINREICHVLRNAVSHARLSSELKARVL